MSFQAKRLRVQLPCGEATVVEEGVPVGGGAAGLCRVPSICHFATPICICTQPTGCHGGSVGCHRFLTCIAFNSGTCNFHSACGPYASIYCGISGGCGPITCDPLSHPQCFIGTICPGGSGPCPGGSEPPIDPGPILVDPEHLPALREALESHLAEIDKAEKELKKREK